MDSKNLSHSMSTPFVSSWLSKARPGELTAIDFETRIAAWAYWALDNLQEVSNKNSSYVSIKLPGVFYPKSKAFGMSPHIQLSTRKLQRSHPDFPERLALIGNSLLTKHWTISEAINAKRILLADNAGNITEIALFLDSYHNALLKAVTELKNLCMSNKIALESVLKIGSKITDNNLVDSLSMEFSLEEIMELFPAAKVFGLTASFESDCSNGDLRTNFGAWMLRASLPTSACFGVISPKLTASFLFSSNKTILEEESLGALLLIGLILKRLLSSCVQANLDFPVVKYKDVPIERNGSYLKAIVAQASAKTPEASLKATEQFLAAYPLATEAWNAMVNWASMGNSLAVTKHDFIGSYLTTLKRIRNKEEPLRQDINNILPLAWDNKNRVVRVTFIKRNVISKNSG